MTQQQKTKQKQEQRNILFTQTYEIKLFETNSRLQVSCCCFFDVLYRKEQFS